MDPYEVIDSDVTVFTVTVVLEQVTPFPQVPFSGAVKSEMR